MISALVAAGVVATLTLSAGSATAADSTWFNGSATINKQYTEGLVMQSRTACKAGFSELQVKGTAQIFAYFGSSWTDSWAVSTTVNGARSYNKCGLKWNMPHASGSTKIVGIALNVGALQRVAADSAAAEVLPVLSEVAAEEGVDESALALAGRAGTAQVWTASSDDSVWAFVVAEDGTVASARTTREALLSDSLSLRLGDSETGVETQVVVVPDDVAEHIAETGALEGFEQLSLGVFAEASRTIGTRAAERAAAPVESTAYDVSGYLVHVLG